MMPEIMARTFYNIDPRMQSKPGKDVPILMFN